MPAIFIAVMRDDPLIVEALLRFGASASDEFVQPPIELPWTALPRVSIDVMTDYPIQYARSLAVLTLLVEAGADPRHGRLSVAIHGGSEAVEFLLARGADPNAEVLGQAPLELLPRLAVVASSPVLEHALERACAEDGRDVVEVLVAHGASLESGAALANAAAYDHVELVRRLLELGADPNATLPDGTTPLIEAAFEGAEASALLLLEAGACPDRRNRFDQSALDGARESGATELFARLTQR